MTNHPCKVLLAGDGFVTNTLLEDALRAEGFGPDKVEMTYWEVPWPYQPFGPVAEVDEASGDEETLIQLLSGVEILLTHMAPVTKRVIESSPALRFVGCGRGGPTNVNLHAVERAGIVFANAPGRNAGSAAEFTLAVLLASYLRLTTAVSDLRNSRWHRERFQFDNTIPDLSEATIGIVGLGAIGTELATMLRPLVGRLVAADPWADPTAAASLGVELVGLDQMLPMCDAISLHSRLTPETVNLLNATRISAMRRGAVLVNTARGALMDYAAAEAALRAGHLAAMAVDVYPEEPLSPDSSLLDVPAALCTPHVGGSSRSAAERGAAMIARAAARYLTARSSGDTAPESRTKETAC
jgi:D-3-phosphoglycerate dehydrogenase